MAAKQAPLTCPGHTRPVVDLAFSDITDHGFFLISACKDGKPMLRHGDTGDWIGTFEGHKGAVWGATLNKDALLAATGAADFTAKIWDAVKGEELTTFSHKHIVKTVDFSQDNAKLLTGSNEKKMRIFYLEKSGEEADIIENVGGNLKACLWLNNDQSILSGGEENIIRLWDVRNMQEVEKITLGGVLQGMQLSKNKDVLSVAYGNTVAFYKTESLEMLKSYEMKTKINSVCLNPAQTIFIAGGEDNIMYKHDYNTGVQQEASHGHFGPIHCVGFSPDGEVYASGSEDGTLRLWQTSVGKTYGLWKSSADEEEQKNNALEQNHCTEIVVES